MTQLENKKEAISVLGVKVRNEKETLHLGGGQAGCPGKSGSEDGGSDGIKWNGLENSRWESESENLKKKKIEEFGEKMEAKRDRKWKQVQVCQEITEEQRHSQVSQLLSLAAA